MVGGHLWPRGIFYIRVYKVSKRRILYTYYYLYIWHSASKGRNHPIDIFLRLDFWAEFTKRASEFARSRRGAAARFQFVRDRVPHFLKPRLFGLFAFTEGVLEFCSFESTSRHPFSLHSWSYIPL